MRDAIIMSFEVRPIKGSSFIVGEDVAFREESGRLIAINENGSPFGIVTESVSEKVRSLDSDNSDDSRAVVESCRDDVPRIAIYQRVEDEIANALSPRKRHLENFKANAKGITLFLLIAGALMIVWGVIAHGNALAEYSDNLREYSSIADDLYQGDVNGANAILFSGFALAGSAGISCFFWIASNLLIAFREDTRENRSSI